MELTDLTKAQQKQLKMQAHALKPVVSIGNKGLTDAVINELEIAFKAHGLIKVKIASDKAGRAIIYDEIVNKLCVHGIQMIGQMGVFYYPDNA